MSLYPAENEHERVLPQPEVDAFRKRIAAVWHRGADHYWWPLSGTRPAHAEAFQADFFEREFGYPALRQILREHGIASVFELREDGRGYEVSIETFEPSYGLEGFWVSDALDWIIYASHESSVTVAGQWLLSAVQAAWPGWQSRVWTTPFYERPQ